MSTSVTSIPINNSQTDAGVKKEKPKQVRESNIAAAKSLGDCIRTSLGPKGMDKMIIDQNKNVTISNDGATILSQMFVVHPIAQMMVDVSRAQDIEAGDGTTSVVIIACSLLDAASKLIDRGIHPTAISEGFQIACNEAMKILKEMASPIDLNDRESLLKSAITSLSSKVVSEYSNILASISVDAVLGLIPISERENENISIDLKDIRIIHKLGGTIEDTEMVSDGFVLSQNFCNNPHKQLIRIEKPKIAVVQFCISPPKTDMDSNVIVTDYTQMDRILKEERVYILKICKVIQKSGCNVILLQKSILRDAITEIGLHLLTKMGISVIKNIERDEIEYICRNLGCRTIASLDHFVSSALATVDIVEEINTGCDKYVKFTGCKGSYKTASIIIRGSNQLVIDEADRSLHDALCVVRSLVKSRHQIAGGGAPETQVSIKLLEYSHTLKGVDAHCVRAFSEALEVIPTTLAENAGLNSVYIMTELRKMHANGIKNAGINVNKGKVEDVTTINVVQPLLVSTSAFKLATEAARCVLKIDDMVQAVR